VGYKIEDVRKENFVINKTTRDEVKQKMNTIKIYNEKAITFNEEDAKKKLATNSYFPKDCISVIPKFDCYMEIKSTKTFYNSVSSKMLNICFMYDDQEILKDIKENNIQKSSNSGKIDLNFSIFKCPKKENKTLPK
jgi:hypothetical protein